MKRREDPKDPWSGDVALPGGMIRPGEDMVRAGFRETLEETGIGPRDLYMYGVVGLEYPRNAPWLRTAILLSKPRNEVILSPGDEVDEVFWFNPRYVNGLRLLSRSNRLVVGYCFNNKVIWGMTWRIIRKLLVKDII